jgi:hypothetical protein
MSSRVVWKVASDIVMVWYECKVCITGVLLSVLSEYVDRVLNGSLCV